MNQAIQRHQGQLATTGSYADALSATKALEQAASLYHLVSPATSVGALPVGCNVAVTLVTVDVENDTYNLTGSPKRGLSKSKLQQIAAALGISWDPIASGRLDDGSNPHYVRWRAVGTYRAFDGQVQTLVAEKELDLRPGSPTVIGLEKQQAAKQKSAENQIREMRMHIQQHAETKAQLRAIRSLGLKTSYTPQELAKPFACARIMFTGQTSDPVLRREFARMTAASFLEGTKGLYGRSPAQGLAEPVPAPARLAAPPPVGTTLSGDSDEYDLDSGESRRPAQPAQPQRRAEATEQPSRPAQTSGEAQTGREYSGFEIPFGNAAGQPIEEASTDDVQWMAQHIRKQLEAKKSRFPKKDEALLAALEAEIEQRQAEPQQKIY